MKFLFLTNPAYGHLNPVLGIIRELVKNENKVVVYNTQEFADKITQTGAEFREPPFKVEKFELRLMNSAANIAGKILEVSKQAVPILTKIIEQEKFDCLLHDSVSLWGKIVGLKCKVPSVSLVTSMAIDSKVLFSYTKFLLPDYLKLISQPFRTLQIFRDHRLFYNDVSEASPYIFDLFVNKEKLNLVLTSEYFQPCRESFDSSFKFVGPIIFNRNEEQIPAKLLQSNKPIIYVSLGTAFNDDVNIYRAIINSLSDSPYQVFISIGGYIKLSDLGKIPGNVFIRSYLPQLEILKRASLFISHGGMNSVNESLYFAVPLLLFPFIQEQRVNSARVEELGAGVVYKKGKISKEELMALINGILTTEFYKKNAEKIRKTLVDAGGLKAATDYILRFVE